MSNELSANIQINISGTYKTTYGVSTPAAAIGRQIAMTLANGVAANQVNVPYSKAGTLTAAPLSIDLNGDATVLEPFGATVVSARMRLIYVGNLATADGNDILIDTSVTHGVTGLTGGAAGKITVPAGGFVIIGAPLATGIPTTAAASDVLKLDPGSNTVPYEVIVFAANA